MSDRTMLLSCATRTSSAVGAPNTIDFESPNNSVNYSNRKNIRCNFRSIVEGNQWNIFCIFQLSIGSDIYIGIPDPTKNCYTMAVLYKIKYI